MILAVVALSALAASAPCPTAAGAPGAAAPAGAASAAVAGRQDVDAVIQRAVAAWGKVRTLRATFEQTVTNPITGSAMTSRGELQQRKPGRLAIRFSDPAGDAIVADGSHVWVYLPSATPGQVIRMTNAQAGGGQTDLIGQFLDAPRRKYDVRDAGGETVNGRRARALILTPRQGERLPFLRAKVWIDNKDSFIRQFESTDANGITRRVRLLRLRPNAAVDPAAFRFSVPAGVRVVQP